MKPHIIALHNFFAILSKYPLMHIAASAPFENIVKIMMELNFFYSFTDSYKTPLSYAIEGENIGVVETILNYFEERPEEFIMSGQEIQNLIENNSVYLIRVLEIILPSEGKRKNSAKLVKESLETFLSPGWYDVQGEKKNLAVYVSAYWHNSVVGSKDSVAILKVLT